MHKIEPLLKDPVETFPFLEEEKETKVPSKLPKGTILTIILAIIVGFFVAKTAYAFYIGFKYYDLRFEDKTKTVEKEDNEKSIPLNSLILNNTYSKYNISSKNAIDLLPIVYSNNSVNVNSLTNNQKLSLVFSNLGLNCDNLTITKSLDEIKISAMELFNDTSFVDNINVPIDNYNINNNNGMYTITRTACDVNSNLVSKRITKATTKDDELYAYEEVNLTSGLKNYKWTYKKGKENNYYLVSVTPQ